MNLVLLVLLNNYFQFWIFIFFEIIIFSRISRENTQSFCETTKAEFPAEISETQSLEISRLSTQSKSNSDIYKDVYQTNQIAESYEAVMAEGNYRKSTTEVYDACNQKKIERTIYDNFSSENYMEQAMSSITFREDQSTL